MMCKQKQILRLAPFMTLVTLSLCIAYSVTSPRKRFYLDVDISGAAILDSLTKVQHFQASTLVFVFAWIAFGNRRLFLSLLLTIMVGIVWELCEATAIGHSARVSDLAPDLVASFGSFLIAVVIGRLLFQHTTPLGSTEFGKNGVAVKGRK